MERQRTFTWENPTIGAKQALTMAGIDYLKAMFNGTLPKPPAMYALDFQMQSIEPGKAVFSFTPQEFHYNPIGTVHGGILSTLLDSAMGCTVHSLLPAGKAYTTLELKVNFLKAVTQSNGQLFAEGAVIHAGNKTALVEARIKDTNGKIYAYGVSTCMIMDIK